MKAKSLVRHERFWIDVSKDLKQLETDADGKASSGVSGA
jgi:hypothetical protein